MTQMENFKLIIKNQTEQLEQVQAFIEEAAERWSLKPALVFEINLILEEYLTNLINYGYSDRADHFINIEISHQQNELRLLITDDAGPFDPGEVPDNEEIDKPLAERKIGGLGIHFIKKLADSIDYLSDEGINRLFISKYISSP